ncbi:transposase [Niameybacter massiliensis]|uniref:Transposase n=1 Tax=Holtiella tumoricola TaxID=3018743 RepID=A0AA42DP96_9FIRM|nr:transposase [Holtiella tumoricola]MDA3732238.1 transposase [Holtiella tumoricola]
MPRVARIKTNDSVFHIMLHSLSEINLFNDSEDKEMYLALIKKAKTKFHFKVYAFCLMTTHAHLVIDSFGSDISKVMHYINLCYSIYYNNKYSRSGPVFRDRFKSKIVNSYKYLVNVCAYIHANPKDLLKSQDTLLDYPYNSLIDYIKGCNRFKILDSAFLISLLALNHRTNRKQYYHYISRTLDTSIIKDTDFPLYTSEPTNSKFIPRIHDPEMILQYVSTQLNQPSQCIFYKYSSSATSLRALTCFMLHAFCNMSHLEICAFIGNISRSRVSSLIAKGMSLTYDMPIIENFISINS